MSKQENVWNKLLFDKSRQDGFVNKNLLLLGRKGSGKRSLLESLMDVSKTQKNFIGSTLRQKGLTSIIDYTYLNLIDLRDPDYNTNARLNVYILEEETQKYLLPQILNHNTIKNTFICIVLDMQEPWTFMEDLDKWITVIQSLLSELKLTLTELEDMKNSVTQYVQQIDGHESVIKINLGIPLMVLINKSDILEREDKGKDWEQKAEIIQFCLRQFCVNYGATLLLTSVKSRINLEIAYNYILHRLYNMPYDTSKIKNLSDFEYLFIPLGQDDLNIIKSTFSKVATSDFKYEESVPIVQLKKNQMKEELTVEDDQDFFAKLKEKSQQQPTTKPILPILPRTTEVQQTPPQTEQPASARGSIHSSQLKEFYDRILTGKNDQQQQQQPIEISAVSSAHTQLHDRIRLRTTVETTQPNRAQLFNPADSQKLQRILPNMASEKDKKDAINLETANRIRGAINNKGQ